MNPFCIAPEPEVRVQMSQYKLAFSTSAGSDLKHPRPLRLEAEPPDQG